MDELRDAINYDPGQHQYERLSEMAKYRPMITEEWIRRSLGTLLSVQKKDEEDDPSSSSSSADKDANEYVFFIHQSVKDFFHQRAETPLHNCRAIGDAAEPDAYLARTRLFYLTADEFRDVGAAATSSSSSDDDADDVSMSAFAALVRKARAAGDFLRDNRLRSDIFEGECARLSDARRFPFLAYARARRWRASGRRGSSRCSTPGGRTWPCGSAGSGRAGASPSSTTCTGRIGVGTSTWI